MPPTTLTPIVYWSQTPVVLHLRVDVKEAIRSSIQLKAVDGGKRITIRAQSALTQQSDAEVTYSVDLTLFDSVMPTPDTQILPHSFNVTFAKLTPGTWSRLLAANKKMNANKVKVDFDRWTDPEEGEDQANAEKQASEKAQLKQEWQNLQSRKSHPSSSSSDPNSPIADWSVTANPKLAAIPPMRRFKLTYLLAYNLFVLVGICLILFLTVQNMWIHYHARASDPSSGRIGHDGGVANAFFFGLSTIHARVGAVAYFVQILATLEIVHAATGLIPGRVLPSFLLNGGRDIILFGCIALFDRTQSDWSVGALYLLWCVGDLVRFVYYLMQLVNDEETAVVAETWFSSALIVALQHQGAQRFFLTLRYTLPLLLLPFGFVMELLLVLAGLDQAELVSIGIGSLTVADLFKGYCALAYTIGAPFLYMAVLKQRKSKLGGSKKGKAKATTASSDAASSSAEVKKSS